jgi:hypothetical protein
MPQKSGMCGVGTILDLAGIRTATTRWNSPQPVDVPTAIYRRSNLKGKLETFVLKSQFSFNTHV